MSDSVYSKQIQEVPCHLSIVFILNNGMIVPRFTRHVKTNLVKMQAKMKRLQV